MVAYLVIDNYRLRNQVSKDLHKNREFNIHLCRESFHHTNNVLFEGDVVSMEEMEFDGSQEDLIYGVFDNILGMVENEQAGTQK